MKKIFIFIFSLYCGQAYSQWIEKDSVETIQEFIDLSDWIHIDGGIEIDCALAFNSKILKTTYFKRLDRSDLLFCKVENIEDSSYDLFFYRLAFDDQNRWCWRRDLVGFRFNKDDVLLETLFFNQNGDVCVPQEFTLSIK